MLEASDTQDPPEYWRLKLRELRTELDTYKDAKALGKRGRAIAESSRKRIQELYKEIAEIHPDPAVKEQMKKDAEEWKKGRGKKETQEPTSVADALIMVIALPIAIVGVSIGSVVLGLGKGLVELGHALSCGTLRTRSNDTDSIFSV